MRFLTARWQDLIMANYEVGPELLASRVPAGTELDTFEGKCFVSLVGFMFLDTRVLGVRVPFHVNFEEVNLRFYIKRELPDETRRAVCFVKEIVPRTAIATVARVLYGEPYERWRMNNERSDTAVQYEWSRGNVRNSLGVEIGQTSGIPPAGSHGEFIIEHYWGYTARGAGRTDEYKVEHPKWELRSVTDSTIDIDIERTYGPEFAFLQRSAPHSVLFAKGSEISVFKGATIKI